MNNILQIGLNYIQIGLNYIGLNLFHILKYIKNHIKIKSSILF